MAARTMAATTGSPDGHVFPVKQGMQQKEHTTNTPGDRQGHCHMHKNCGFALRGDPAGFGLGSGLGRGELGEGDRILELRAQSFRDAG